MITVIRGSLLSLFYYWKKPVTGCPGRPHQNRHFIVVIGPQGRLSPSPKSDENELQVENSRLITALYTTRIIQIPIVFPHVLRGLASDKP
jgi:hypothetical protein